jgi:hypothetical protein
MYSSTIVQQTTGFPLSRNAYQLSWHTSSAQRNCYLDTTQCAEGCDHGTIFMLFRKIAENFVMSVRLPAWNNSASTGGVFMKFDIREFFGNLSRNLKFYQNLTRREGTLQEGSDHTSLDYS